MLQLFDIFVNNPNNKSNNKIIFLDIWPSNIRVKDLLLKCGMPACHACKMLTGKTTYLSMYLKQRSNLFF